MSENRFTAEKRASGTPDAGGWSPGFGPLLLIVLGCVLLIVFIILGVTTGITFLFAIPFVLVGLGIAVLLMRGHVKKSARACPHCGERINFPPHMSEFNCPNCGNRIEGPKDHGLSRAA